MIVAGPVRTHSGDIMQRLMITLLIAFLVAALYAPACTAGDKSPATPFGIVRGAFKMRTYAAAFEPGTHRLLIPVSQTGIGVFNVRPRPLEPASVLTGDARAAAEKLIAELNHPEFAMRMAAARQLHAMSDAVKPLLVAAQQRSVALEPRMAATRLLQLLEAARLKRMIERVRPAGIKKTYDVMRAIQYSRDGNRLMMCGSRLIVIRDQTTGENTRVFSTATGRFYDAFLLPDGKRLAAANRNEVVVWHLQTGRMLRRFKQFKSNIYRIDVSPDGRTLAVCGRDRRAMTLNIDSGRILQKFEDFSDYVRDVSIAPSGRQLATASEDGGIALWDLASGKFLRRMTIHRNQRQLTPHEGAFDVEFSPCGRYLASCGGRGDVVIWNLQTGDATQLTPPGVRDIGHLRFSPDGRLLLCSLAKSQPRLWAIR